MSASTVIPLGPDAESLRVVIEPPRPEGDDPRVDERWAELCARNPRLFNGRILAFLGFDPRSNILSARVEEFRRMAVQPQVRTGLTQFGVTGVLTAPCDGSRRFLLGRRGRQTHLYPGRWELAPSGGVEPPGDAVLELSMDDLRGQIEREVAEETGLSTAGARTRPIALCHDPAAPSTDVIFAIDLAAAAVPIAPNWEYQELAWIDPADAAFDARGFDVIEPSRAVLRWLGWIR